MQYFASAMMLLMLVLMVMYLTYIPVPEGNKEIILLILGVLTGGGAAAIPNLFGDADSENEKLRERVRHLEHKLAVVTTQYDEVKHQYDVIVEMLIDRHVVPEAHPTVELKALPNGSG
ncbi:MAG: hypothetical protein ACK5MY_02465 [Jhaorihella sp.]